MRKSPVTVHLQVGELSMSETSYNYTDIQNEAKQAYKLNQTSPAAKICYKMTPLYEKTIK